MVNRTKFLRQETMKASHKVARIALDTNWSTKELDLGISQRKAMAIKMILEKSPIYIGEKELIVGTRTIYRDIGESEDKSYFSMQAMPSYINEKDVEKFGGLNAEFQSKTHYALDFSIILKNSIDGMIAKAEKSLETHTREMQIDCLQSIIIVYKALSTWIEKYSVLAAEMAQNEKEVIRKSELERIAEVCAWISHNKPRNFQEAAQLYWFMYLATIIENFQWVNYGRIDQYLYPYYKEEEKEEIQQLIECFLLRMSDGVDIVDPKMGQFNAQINITLGGVTPQGDDAANELTFMFLKALDNTRLAEPEISVRVHSKNPDSLLEEASKLSVSGLNCIAYYNDDQFIKSMINVGIKPEYARDYAFDLCQDITIPGKGDFFVAGNIDLTLMLMETLQESHDNISFEEFKVIYKKNIAKLVKETLEGYRDSEAFIRTYASGKEEILEEYKNNKRLNVAMVAPFMSPLPFTSSLFEGTIEKAQDIRTGVCPVENKGVMISNLVVAINSLAAIRKTVFDDKQFTLTQVRTACETDFKSDEKMRQILWNTPKWANDDDYVDLPAKEIIEFACDEVLKYKTINGFAFLAGIHQPHPVFKGWQTPATPEGRFAKSPIPVTLSPENGTMLNGPTAAFQSAAKIDPMKYQWNFCVMLQYFSSVFNGNDGHKIFVNLIKSYFKLGGTQHQPNVVNIEDLRQAQITPEKYRDLIVRMWGVSAHFVQLPKELQDEFIARCENI